jgi:GDP-L-fucose synthase
MTHRMNSSDAVFVAGHRGLVGSAIVRSLSSAGYERILTQSRAELDLRDASAVEQWFTIHRPDVVVLAAARVGGIYANSTYPADFIMDNLAIQQAVIGASFRAGVKRLLFLGSSCIYPRDCAQPIREDYLLTGPLEPTNRAYAVAKIAGLELIDALNRQHGTCYQAVMPTNLYGPNDNFDPMNSHVLPALIRRFEEARLSGAESVVVWGTGTPRREFLHSDDLAAACRFLLEETDDTRLFNVGTGEDITIRELATLVAESTGFRGDIVFDPSKPDGTPRKVLDISRIRQLGWQPKIQLVDGLSRTIHEYRCRSQASL